MDEANKLSIAESMRVIAANFKAELPERLTRLGEALAGLPSSVDDARHIAHKLAGSCGVFGLSHMSITARRIETTLDVLIEQKRNATEQETGFLAKCLQALHTAVASGVEIEIKSTDSVHPGESLLVYVVDDDIAALDLMCAQLRQRGFSVKGFDTLDGARLACKQNAPQAVLLDVMFPDENMDGIDAAQSIQDAAGKAIPIILASSKQDMETRMRAAGSVAALYMTKPLDLSVVEKKLWELAGQTSPQSYRVAMIDDDASVTDYYQSLLSREGYAVTAINDPLQAMGILMQLKPHLIVLDLKMPNVSGSDLARIIRKDGTLEAVPIVFLSAEANPKLQEEAFSVGGQDFLNKPVSDKVFLEAIRQHVVRGRELSRRMAAVSRIDPMTGLVTGKYFVYYMAKLMEQGAQNNKATLVYAVIPQFQSLLRTQGYAYLDELNRRTGRAMEAVLGRDAVICTLAPGTFAGVVTGQEAKSVIDGCRKLTTIAIEGGVSLSAKIGLLPLENVTGNPVSVLAMARDNVAKNKADLWVASVAKPAATGDMVEQIRAALKRHDMKLFFRPIVCIDDSMRKLVEVFAQLEIAPGKLVSQKAYGPVADELKMGVELDRILTMGVMAELDTRRSAHVDIEVFIPLSSDSVVSPAYLNWLESSLIFTPLDKKHNLVLVVGREALLNGGKLLRDFLDKTHLLGCKAALASYGRDADDGKRIDSGASISPTFFDYVLLDEKLIADFESGAVAPMVVFSAVEAAKRLRAKVIACGVKEPKTIAQLWRLGVRDYQGYLVEAPKTTMDLSAAIPQIFV